MRLTLLTTTASAALVLLTSVAFAAEPMASKGISPYVTHFIFRPLTSIDVPGVGTVTSLEAVGTNAGEGILLMCQLKSSGRTHDLPDVTG
jgi:hypothetical protein